MFAFALTLWRYGRLSEEQLDGLVERGRLTEEEGEEIRATPRVG